MAKKKLFITLLILILVISMAGFVYFYPEITGYAGLFELDSGDDSKVERVFSEKTPQGEEKINVTLVVTIDPDYEHQALAIEEEVPSEVSITDSGSAIQEGKILRWSIINDTGNLESKNYSYEVEYPNESEKYCFSGSYVIDGMHNSTSINGEKCLGEGEDSEEGESGRNNETSEDNNNDSFEGNREETGNKENSSEEKDEKSKSLKEKIFLFTLVIVLIALVIGISLMIWLYYKEKNI